MLDGSKRVPEDLATMKQPETRSLCMQNGGKMEVNSGSGSGSEGEVHSKAKVCRVKEGAMG